MFKLLTFHRNYIQAPQLDAVVPVGADSIDLGGFICTESGYNTISRDASKCIYTVPSYVDRTKDAAHSLRRSQEFQCGRRRGVDSTQIISMQSEVRTRNVLKQLPCILKRRQ